MLKYPALIHHEEDGYWVEFPDVEGVHTQGDTMEELIFNAEDALSSHLGVLLDYGKNIPDPSNMKGENVININVQPDTAIPILLRKVREEKKLTQKDMAEMLNISYQAYQRLENASKFNARIKTLQKIVNMLGKRFMVDIV